MARIGRFHSSLKPPVVIVDAQDEETSRAVGDLLPGARIVRQSKPDGVANALLLAQLFGEALRYALGRDQTI